MEYDYSGNITDNYLDQSTKFIDKKYYSLDNNTKIKHYVTSVFIDTLKII